MRNPRVTARHDRALATPLPRGPLIGRGRHFSSRAKANAAGRGTARRQARHETSPKDSLRPAAQLRTMYERSRAAWKTKGDSVIEFDRELESFVRQKVESGHFASRESLLSHAVRLLQRDREEAVAGIQLGLQDAERRWRGGIDRRDGSLTHPACGRPLTEGEATGPTRRGRCQLLDAPGSIGDDA